MECYSATHPDAIYSMGSSYLFTKPIKVLLLFWIYTHIQLYIFWYAGADGWKRESKSPTANKPCFNSEQTKRRRKDRGSESKYGTQQQKTNRQQAVGILFSWISIEHWIFGLKLFTAGKFNAEHSHVILHGCTKTRTCMIYVFWHVVIWTAIHWTFGKYLKNFFTSIQWTWNWAKKDLAVSSTFQNSIGKLNIFFREWIQLVKFWILQR